MMDEENQTADPFPETLKESTSLHEKAKQNLRFGLRIAIGVLLIGALILLPRFQDRIYSLLPLIPPFGVEGSGSLDWLPELKASPTFTPNSGFDRLFTPTPAATQTVQDQPIEMEESPYIHPQGHFQFEYPAGWTVEGDDQEATILTPDRSGRILIQVTDTGKPLDADSFKSFVEGREANQFTQPDSTESAYIPLEESIDESGGSAVVTKELYRDGEFEVVRSRYLQDGELIYTGDLWTREDLLESHARAMDLIWDSISGNSEEAGDLEAYHWVLRKEDPEKSYSVDVPIPWLPEQTRSRSSSIESYHSPDQHGIIQLIRYTTEIDLSDATVGNFVLQLLRDYYTRDVVITADQIVSNGNEQLTWYSPSGGYRGITQFRRIGLHTLVILTIIIDNDYLEIYQDLRDRTMDSFVIEGSTE
ncbi:MAG: hypothetical protein A2Z16_03130 [Chloroflexi bacterium RBG_16_54_18]|nr:MAG: hypothetical protein A2Z16_03130 [Chloroflexi bacterium RBG_16_54_18]